MKSFPTPPPDRRIEKDGYQHQKNNSIKQDKIPFINNINSSTKENIMEFEKINNINMVKIKHIEDMRNSILSYKVIDTSYSGSSRQANFLSSAIKHDPN